MPARAAVCPVCTIRLRRAGMGAHGGGSRPAAPRTGDAVQEFLQKQFHQRKKIYFCKRACAY